MLITKNNPKYTLSISGLDIAVLLLGSIVLEGIKVTLRYRHVAMYSDNTPTVALMEYYLQNVLRQQEDSFGH